MKQTFSDFFFEFQFSLVFHLVEAEEECVEQLETLISCFLRPFKMAASSKSPPCSHEDINSIFLNSETVLFLHQIFLKGLTARMDSWPTLVLGTSLGATLFPISKFAFLWVKVEGATIYIRLCYLYIFMLWTIAGFSSKGLCKVMSWMLFSG